MTPDFLQSMRAALQSGQSLILVTVSETRGSVPRMAGASMLVGQPGSEHSLLGTIGGGQLEYRAIGIARELLDATVPTTPGLNWVRFPLGASVGQCCGGVVSLAFETIDSACLPWIEDALAFSLTHAPWMRTVPFDAPCSASQIASPQAPRGFPSVIGAGGTASGGDFLSERSENSAQRILDTDGRPCFVHRVMPPALHIALFGAGHVGRALATTLAPLPLAVTWVDPREQEFGTDVPTQVRVVCSDAPDTEVAKMPANSAYLILTHSHALDFEILRAVLQRDDTRFVGMIGSRAKRKSFEQRLRQRGFGEAQLSRLTCPIGLRGIVGKEPAVIALAVAAQMMQVARSAQQQKREGERNVG